MPNRLLAFTLTALIIREKGSKEEQFHVGYDAENSKTPASALEELISFFNDEFDTDYIFAQRDELDLK